MPVHVNSLCYGDCLDWMQRWDDESVDLIYLDPPFNSSATYNVLYAQDSAGGAQTRAFADTWTWDAAAGERLAMYEGATGLTGSQGDRRAGEYSSARPGCWPTSRTWPSVWSTCVRLLKPTGSLYYHCDTTASHCLKVLLDAIFGPASFRNEIAWHRTNAKGLASRRFASNHDIILSYGCSETATWNTQHTPYDSRYIKSHYGCVEPKSGRRYQLDNLTNPNKNRPNLEYEFLGVTRVWRWTQERMQRAYESGRIVQTGPGSPVRYKRYLDAMPGVPVDDVWADVPPINSQAKERPRLSDAEASNAS